MGKIPWDVVTKEFGIEQAYVLELITRLIVSWVVRSTKGRVPDEDDAPEELGDLEPNGLDDLDGLDDAAA